MRECTNEYSSKANWVIYLEIVDPVDAAPPEEYVGHHHLAKCNVYVCRFFFLGGVVCSQGMIHIPTHKHTKTQQSQTHQLREGALAGDAVVNLRLVQPQNLAQHARLPVEQALSGRVLCVLCVCRSGGGVLSERMRFGPLSLIPRQTPIYLGCIRTQTTCVVHPSCLSLPGRGHPYLLRLHPDTLGHSHTTCVRPQLSLYIPGRGARSRRGPSRGTWPAPCR